MNPYQSPDPDFLARQVAEPLSEEEVAEYVEPKDADTPESLARLGVNVRDRLGERLPAKEAGVST